MRAAPKARRPYAAALTLAAALLAADALSAQWAHWRGPTRDGASPETGLISEWSLEGDNLLWKAPLVGRSTPVVFDGRVCVNGRVGEGITRQEMAACYDAETGEQLWEHRFNVYHTSVPWTRVGWANVAGDPETGYLYVQGVGGHFYCIDSRDGSIVWWKPLIEEYGFMEGYGGRTQTPFVDGDRVIVSFSNTSWGGETKPLHRYRAFDKRTGELLWVSQPADSQSDKNTQSTPNVLVVGEKRLIVAGNGDGGIYAVEAYTGEPVWGFSLSQRGINTSVVVDGSTVFAAHSEENVDGSGTMGRVVAIDGTGSGDVTATHERWRLPLGVGFSSPGLADGRLYLLDNSANLYAVDAASGEQLWEVNVGRVGKASPVIADGKVYVTEVNGRFAIVETGDEEASIADLTEIPMPGEGRPAEIYSSVAVADGRLYFTTEEGLYALGDPEREAAPATPPATAPAAATPPSGSGDPARLRVMPAEVLLYPGESAELRAMAFDADGNPLGERSATWSLAGLGGEVDAEGRYTAPDEHRSQQGRVVARVGDLEASGRVRVMQGLPITESFDSVGVGSQPGYAMAYAFTFKAADLDGERVFAKGPSPVKIDRHITFLGRHDLSDYTIAGDVMATREGRRWGDVGLINSGYTLELLGAHRSLEVRSWQAGLRMAKRIDFAWEPGVWYRMVFEVRERDGKALVRGKVWPKGEPEPEEWSITAEDPLPISAGAPGLSAYSPALLYFDNIEVTKNR